MTGTAETDLTEERFLAIVDAIGALNPELTRLGAALLIAGHLDVAGDSRSFARILGVEHALVLRELSSLSEDGILLRVTDRVARTQRASYELTAGGDALVTLALSDLQRASAAT